MAKKKLDRLDGVSTTAAEKATGYGWNQWVTMLDKAGAKDWTHKEIVAYLKENYDLSPWWRQTVTVAYEKAKGKRVIGQTADAGFQVGVQKTLPLPISAAWKLLSSKKGINCWLGKVNRVSLTEGRSYETDTGIEGEFRVVKPGTRVRLTWQRPGMTRPATLQITLTSPAPKRTSVRVHLENLPSQESREEMKTHWKETLTNLAEIASA